MSQVNTSSRSEIKELQARLKELKANEVKNYNKDLKVTTKIGDKGTLNFYGMRAGFPICLYMSEIIKLQKLFASPEFQKFVTENADKLAVKKSEVKAE